MRRMRQGLGLLCTLILGVLGCADRNISLRPPKHPDEIVLPPQADSRFANPPIYPEVSNPNKDPDRVAGGGTPNVGAMNMGGMGGGGMGMPGMGAMGMGSGAMMGGYGGR